MATLDVLKARQAKLKARIQQLEAKSKVKERKLDTRRKVLLGALLQEWMDKDHETKQRVEKALPKFLTRDLDRAVFGINGAMEKTK